MLKDKNSIKDIYYIFYSLKTDQLNLQAGHNYIHLKK